jgi:hypothetical protein
MLYKSYKRLLLKITSIWNEVLPNVAEPVIISKYLYQQHQNLRVKPFRFFCLQKRLDSIRLVEIVNDTHKEAGSPPSIRGNFPAYRDHTLPYIRGSLPDWTLPSVSGRLSCVYDVLTYATQVLLVSKTFASSVFEVMGPLIQWHKVSCKNS